MQKKDAENENNVAGTHSEQCQVMQNIDEEYWKGLEDANDCTDPLATIAKELNALMDYAEVINKILPDVTSRLKLERKVIVRSTARSFSDIMTMIDEFNDGDESTYETAMKICDHYRATKVGA